MFNSISWQEFLTAIAFIAGSYYVIGTLLFYRVEIANIFNRRVSKSISPGIREDQNESNEVNDLMGGIKFESLVNVPHEKTVESDEINVTHSTEPDEPIESRDPLVDSFKELHNEIEIIAEGFAQEGKEESILLLKSLLPRYPQLSQTQYEEKINRFVSEVINEKYSAHLEPNEIKSWWTEAEVSMNNHH